MTFFDSVLALICISFIYNFSSLVIHKSKGRQLVHVTLIIGTLFAYILLVQ